MDYLNENNKLLNKEIMNNSLFYINIDTNKTRKL